MSKLADIMGDDFAEEYEEQREAARREANRVDKKTLMEIAYHAIHGDGFEGEDPRFTYTGDTLEHDVLLMESPDDNLGKFKNPFDNGGMSMGMFHMDKLFSCAFNEEMLDIVDKIEESTFYLVVGGYEEVVQGDGSGDEEKYYNINPVRGFIPLEVAKNYADEYESQMDGASVEEQAQDQQEETSNGSSDSNGVSVSDSLGDTEEASRSNIIQVFQAVGNDAPAVLEGTADGDSDSMDKLVEVTQSNTEGEAARERVLDVFEEEVEEIDGRGEDEEEDDGIDLNDISSSSGEEEDTSTDVDTTSEEPDTDTEEETEGEDEGDDDGDVDAESWF
jgi:hypothetical protein